MITCDVPSQDPVLQAVGRCAAGVMDDLYVDVDCADAPIESPRGIERCIRTDSFLQEIVHDRGVVRLSKNEYRFLSVLVRSEGKTLTAGELMSSRIRQRSQAELALRADVHQPDASAAGAGSAEPAAHHHRAQARLSLLPVRDFCC